MILAFVVLTVVLCVVVGRGGGWSPWDIPLVTNAPLWTIRSGH